MSETEHEKAVRLSVEDLEMLIKGYSDKKADIEDEETLGDFDDLLMGQYLLITDTRGLDVLLEALDRCKEHPSAPMIVQHGPLIQTFIDAERSKEAMNVSFHLLMRSEDLDSLFTGIRFAKRLDLPSERYADGLKKLRRKVLGQILQLKAGDLNRAYINSIQLAELSDEKGDLIQCIQVLNELGARAGSLEYALILTTLSQWPDAAAAQDVIAMIANTERQNSIRRKFLKAKRASSN